MGTVGGMRTRGTRAAGGAAVLELLVALVVLEVVLEVVLLVVVLLLGR